MKSTAAVAFLMILLPGCGTAVSEKSSRIPRAGTDEVDASFVVDPALESELQDALPAGLPQRTEDKVRKPERSTAPQIAKDNRDRRPSAGPGDSQFQAGLDTARDAEPTRERFAVFVEGGPLIVEIMFTIDENPYNTMRESMIAEVLQAADTNSDGVATWDEVLRSPKFEYGQYGNIVITGASQSQELRQQYDTNSNGRLDRSEVPRFVTQGRGSTSAFSLTRSSLNAGLNNSTSALQNLLDTDQNGKLTLPEIAAAPQRLLTRDHDDDAMLVAEDFRTAPQRGDGQTLNASPRRSYVPQSWIVLGPQADWDEVIYTIHEIYGFESELLREHFQLVPDLFSELDVNGDERVDDDEIKNLNKATPAFQLMVRFGETSREPAATALHLSHLCDDLKRANKSLIERENRFSLQLDHAVLTFAVLDPFAQETIEQQVEAQLSTFDSDANGWFAEEEFAESFLGQAVPFVTMDVNTNEKIDKSEMISFLATQQLPMRAQISTHISDTEDALFGTLDADRNGRLDSREIAMSSAMLTTLDNNSDGQLTTAEIPSWISIGFLRGNSATVEALISNSFDATSSPHLDLPIWFTGMDVNRDGSVSFQEFLGTETQFKSFDQDADGFLGWSEVRLIAVREGH